VSSCVCLQVTFVEERGSRVRRVKYGCLPASPHQVGDFFILFSLTVVISPKPKSEASNEMATPATSKEVSGQELSQRMEDGCM
jgi:hypothetical protein